MSFKAAPEMARRSRTTNCSCSRPTRTDKGARRQARRPPAADEPRLRQAPIAPAQDRARRPHLHRGAGGQHPLPGAGHAPLVRVESSQEPRRAPLILVPVALERSNVRERFRLRYTEEDLEDNLSLMNKLRLEFGIDLPEMPPQEDLDVGRLLRRRRGVRRASLPRWSVDRDAVVLGFFSFGKLLMYRDLDGENWPRGRGPSDHPVIQTLFDESPSRSGRPNYERTSTWIEHINPAEVHQVMDADSSQTLALLDVEERAQPRHPGTPGNGEVPDDHQPHRRGRRPRQDGAVRGGEDGGPRGGQTPARRRRFGGRLPGAAQPQDQQAGGPAGARPHHAAGTTEAGAGRGAI